MHLFNVLPADDLPEVCSDTEIPQNLPQIDPETSKSAVSALTDWTTVPNLLELKFSSDEKNF